MWMKLPFVLLVVFASSGWCIQMTVQPDVVIPGMTPDFYLLCSVPSSNIEKVVSLTISRQTAYRMNQRPESVVVLDSKNPSKPRVHAHVTKKLHATGFLPGFNSLGVNAHLHVTWPSPGLDDIGLYFCQADVMHRSGSMASRSSAVIVSSADAGIQRTSLLKQLEDQIRAIYKKFYSGGRGETTATTHRHHETTTPAPVATTQPPTTTTTQRPTTTTTHRIFWPTTPAQTAEPTEVVEAEPYDVVEDFFTFANHTYFFVNASIPKPAEDALTMCEDAGMALAHIPSQSIYEKLRMFFASLLPPQESMLLSLRSSTGAWSWPYKGDRFFLTLHLNTGTEMTQCLAITSTGKTETALTLVPCTSLFKFYVCSLPQNIMA